MSSVTALLVALALAACIAPVLVLRPRAREGRTFGPDQPLPPGIVRNAWLAYLVRFSLFVPLFTLGAMGDVWPTIAGAAGFAAGMVLLDAVRRLPAVDGIDRPPTMPIILSGGSRGVRVVVTLASATGLFGLAGAEAAALASVMAPLMGDGVGIPIFAALVALAALHVAIADVTAMRLVAQALLGAIFIGLVGVIAVLLYVNATDLRPMSPPGAFSLLAVAAFCLALPIYRQTKFVETPHLVGQAEPSRWRRMLGRQVRLMQRLVNLMVSVLAVTALVVAGMQLYILGLPGVAARALEAFGGLPQVPIIGCLAIVVLALTYPLVDAVAWEKVGALAAVDEAGGLRRSIRGVGREAALLWLVLIAFGALATMATDLPADEVRLRDLVRQLILFDNEVARGALAFLFLTASAMAISSMGMAGTTALALIRHGTMGVGLGGGGTSAPLVAGGIAVAASLVWVASGVPSATLDVRFLAVALAFVVLQVSLLPLLAAPWLRIGMSGAGAALIAAGGSAAGLGCVAAWAGTGDATWLWAAVPATEAVGLSLLAILRMARPSREAAG